ncbi:DUF1684 domain-containing protein [Spirosoma rhododendri]|uniref:DUF1684 domain-containing protein n=1 Tax=Spirosoma rhododendri TaxID=2728024 RepID=A0A7L5DN72_9BACT|nr:DUF1684 domain-containing protein [Spirosoma rhododendri]QJD77200.1 DUF1684 domain-containing protein [Spirosoma rhododendri]
MFTRFLFTIACLWWAGSVSAQTAFADQIARHRDTYRKDFLTSTSSPLQSKEAVDKLSFYAPDSTYRVVADVQRIEKAEPFDMPTYSGKTQPYVAYATVSFALRGQLQQLTIYRSLNLQRMPEYRDYLFLPFKDATSGKETYGGGRYLDLRLGEIQNGKLTLDFNKAYNPYCAYADGYSCPIPPKSNVLPVAVAAGERVYEH